MRSLSRLIVLGALSALAIAPSAMAAPALTAAVSPNKGGTVTQGNPIAFKLSGQFPDTPSDPSGNVQLQSVVTKLPTALLFNTIPFSYCVGDQAAGTGFFATHTCPSATKLGSATITADAASAGIITATADLYFGAGFAVYAVIKASQPAVIDQAVQAQLRSSGSNGYGLALDIPVPNELRQPITGIYPTVKAVTATVKPAVKSVSVKGVKGKVKVPLVGLGPCSGGKLPFEMDVNYTDKNGLTTIKTDSAKATASCKK